MDYFELKILCSAEQKDFLPILLGETGFEAFAEDEDYLLAYVQQQFYNEEETEKILSSFSNISYQKKLIKNRNWNLEWENSFQPVIVDNKVIVKAPFHNIDKEFDFIITIEPKMAFGTGHHATTYLVMKLMLEQNFNNKKVMDYGTGTAILAILAEMLNARQILAFDNDEIAVNNARENIVLNNCSKITAKHGIIEDIADVSFDIILANITRNTVLNSLTEINNKLIQGGLLFTSGYYQTDLDDMKLAATEAGFDYLKHYIKDNWVATLFKKK